MRPGSGAILLVENNPDDVEPTMLALERYRLGGRLAVATDGAQALGLLIVERATRFAFVMLDLKLPSPSRRVSRHRPNPACKRSPATVVEQARLAVIAPLQARHSR